MIRYSSFYALFILLIFILNRSIAKIGIGGIFYLDVIILSSFIIFSREYLRILQDTYLAIFYILLGLGWLVFEIYFDYYDYLNIRRFALSFYILAPFLVYACRTPLFYFLNNYSKYLAFLLMLGVYLKPENIIFSLSAEACGYLVLLSLLDKFYGSKNVSWLSISYLTAVFTIIASGFISDGSLYRTPFFALAGASAIIFFHQSMIALRTTEGEHLWVFISLACLFIFGPLFLFATDTGLTFTQHILFALGGLIGSDEIKDFAYGLLPYIPSARGDAVGNAEVRVLFWNAILSNSFSSFSVFLFGEGHEFNFFIKLFPNMVFIDPELIEPHNSLISIIFKYGYIGLFLFLGVVLQFLKLAKKDNASSTLPSYLACAAYAFIYISFEVALESPQGAVLFWIFIVGASEFSSLTNNNSIYRQNNYSDRHENTSHS